MIKLRIKQLPVETLDVGKRVLVMGTTLPLVEGLGSFLQGPCVLEFYNDETGEVMPVEFTQ